VPTPNLFQRLVRAFDTKSYSVSDPAFPLSIFGALPTATGLTVTPASAMRVPAVAQAVRLIGEAAGTTPAKLFARDPKAPAPDHPAYGLVHDFANEWTSAAELRESVTADALLHGHGYARAIVVNSAVQELHQLDPCTVTRKRHDLTGEPFYIVGKGASAYAVPFNEMLHVADFDGVASIYRGREAIGLAALLERHTAKFFANGARPSGVVTFSEKMPPAAMANIIAAWNAAHTGENAGYTAFIDGTGGGDFKTVTPSAQGSELSIQRRHQVVEIARHLGVPPTLLFDLERGTWSNVEQLRLQFLQFTMRPWLQRWADAYTRVLLTPADRETHYVEFLVDDLGSADLAAQATAFGQYRSMGVMSANEVRHARNLPAHPDGDGLANPYTTSTTPEKAAA
jgi:HK97 family phage portal protein